MSLLPAAKLYIFHSEVLVSWGNSLISQLVKNLVDCEFMVYQVDLQRPFSVNCNKLRF